MIASVWRAKEAIRSLGRLVRVALIPQALGLCLIACSQTVGQGPATHGVASACQAESLTELVKKLEAAALDDSFFKPGFVSMATPFWTSRHPIAASIGMHSCNSGTTARSPT